MKETGQIYVPFVNWGLFGGVVIAVVLFGSSDNLGAAYGITVTIDMLITTTMTFFVVRYGWHYPWIVAVGAFFRYYYEPTFGLLSQARQAQCFASVARVLEPGGMFVIECFVPDLTRFDHDQPPRGASGGAGATSRR